MAASGAIVDYCFAGDKLSYNEGYLGTAASLRYEYKLQQKALEYCLGNHLRFSTLNVDKTSDQCQPTNVLVARNEILASKSIKQLKTIRVDTKRIGMAIANTFVWVTRDEYAEPAMHPELINQLFDVYLKSYSITKCLLAKKNYNYLLLFNGRFCSACASSDAAHDLGINVLYHERGALPDRYSLLSFMPHDRIKVQRQILSYWNYANLLNCDQEQIAENFFIRKREGDGLSWHSFTSSQKHSRAASLIGKIKMKGDCEIIATYFASSDDEFIALDDETFPEGPFGSQLESLSLFQRLALKSVGHLIIRLHPNMRNNKGPYMDVWKQQLSLPNPKVTFLEPDSDVSSYELLDLSDIVIVYNSTIGIEAVAAGKPVIQLGYSFYDEIGASLFRPSDIHELKSAVSSALSMSVNPSSALPYGYWGLTFGSPYSLFSPKGLHGGTFLGVYRYPLLYRVKAKTLSMLRSIKHSLIMPMYGAIASIRSSIWRS
jgi:hypothetical protein